MLSRSAAMSTLAIKIAASLEHVLASEGMPPRPLWNTFLQPRLIAHTLLQLHFLKQLRPLPIAAQKPNERNHGGHDHRYRMRPPDSIDAEPSMARQNIGQRKLDHPCRHDRQHHCRQRVARAAQRTVDCVLQSNTAERQ